VCLKLLKFQLERERESVLLLRERERVTVSEWISVRNAFCRTTSGCGVGKVCVCYI
jgi:hypothetical protein